MGDDIRPVAAGNGPASLPPGPAVHKDRRQRRPTGAPPPLPHPITISTTAWLILGAVALAGAFLASQHTPWLRIDDRASTWVLRLLAGIRTPWLTDVANGINGAGSGWGATALGLSVVALTMAFRRWRHLLVFLGSVLFLEIAGTSIYFGLSRPRPYGVTIIGSWGGYSGVSGSAAVLTIFLMGAVYCLAVPGRPRTYAKAAVAVVVAVFCLARLYLGVDHPSDALLAVALAVAIPVTAFRYFTPNEAFPVAYRRGNTAHVDVTGRRGQAIRQAVRDQLGLTVTEIKPVGLESSAGSTPLRLRVEGSPEEFVFAKLYTKGHVRADRWYKLWRTILYGSLEDEHPFQTVRRLVEYEDYALRLLQDIGVRTARPYGIVEITPEREYMLVTEFHTGAVEIGEADVDDTVIDQGLQLIRTLWDAGIAHRDIKPGNLMVRSGELLLIDVAFVQVRPSPWRQAVDLGNMMLVLAVRTDPQRVYRRALAYFTEAELAEAFAATRGVASPTQLRAFMKRHPRDLLGEFRALAPARPPIALQRWSIQAGRAGGRDARHHHRRRVRNRERLLPGGQKSGRLRPQLRHRPFDDPQRPGSPVRCPAALHRRAPGGLERWRHGHRQREGQLRAGLRFPGRGRRRPFRARRSARELQSVTITLTATCDIAGARQIPSGQPGMRRFERPPSQVPGYSGVRYDVFPGGCVTYRFVLRARRVPGPGHHCRQRGGVHAPVGAGRLRPAHRGPGPVRARCRMPRVTRAATARRQEEALLGRPRQAALLDRRGGGGHGRGVRTGRGPRHAGPHPAA